MFITPLDRSVEREDATQTAAEILNAALSEDSLGLTPPRPAGRRERAASSPRSRRDVMPHREVLRSASVVRRGGGATLRAASPAEPKKLTDLQAAVPPVDASTEARLTAPEANAGAGYAYMHEAGLDIHALQAWPATTQHALKKSTSL